MPKYLATDVDILVNSQNISDWCFSVDTPDTKDQVDVSGFNPNSTKEFLPGQRDQTITLGILQDFGATQIHSVLYPLYSNNTVFAIEVRPTSAGRSATNPWYGGSANLYEYDGLNAQLNARGELTATMKPASNTFWTWATA